jgi:3-oxoisoapionate kinase
MSDRLFAYYGDDFTGSTDVLEALASNGVSTVLFLDAPDVKQLGDFSEYQAIGVAGESRSRDPEWMSAHLPPIFRTLKTYGAPVCQYKICSTFDSSPEHGSIGRALEIGQDVFGAPCVPIIAGAPHLKRFVLFGNLFAAGPGGGIYRIDRHPGMCQHPVTPMRESDLRMHLKLQTTRTIALLDILALHGENPDARLDEILSSSPSAVLFDGLDEASLAVAGRLVSERNHTGQAFAVGSAGLTHALILYWRQAGMIPQRYSPCPGAAADRLIVISGSCSPVTEGQIRWAMQNGFAHFRVNPQTGSREVLVHDALAALAEGSSIVLYTTLGLQHCNSRIGGESLGAYLGSVLRELLVRSEVRRVLIAGGDTSTHAVRQLGIHALTFSALTAPGAPLCRCDCLEPALDGVEIVLKGGQVGPEHYFEMVRKGK